MEPIPCFLSYAIRYGFRASHIEPITFVLQANRLKIVYSVTMFDSVLPISIVIIAVSVNKSAMAIEVVIFERAFVDVTLFEVQFHSFETAGTFSK